MPKYWGKQIVTREFPRSGSKAKDGEREEEKKRPNDGNNNGQLRNANTTSGGARKAAWANSLDVKGVFVLCLISISFSILGNY